MKRPTATRNDQLLQHGSRVRDVATAVKTVTGGGKLGSVSERSTQEGADVISRIYFYTWLQGLQAIAT